MFRLTTRGSFGHMEHFLQRMLAQEQFTVLEKYGAIGVEALSHATPQDTGITAGSWSYNIIRRRGYYCIAWTNAHVHENAHIAILIEHGHGTREGGYVHGRDFINPAMQPVFDKMAVDMWKEVTRS